MIIIGVVLIRENVKLKLQKDNRCSSRGHTDLTFNAVPMEGRLAIS